MGDPCVHQQWTYRTPLGWKSYLHSNAQGAPGFQTLLCISLLSLSVSIKFVSCL
jgi:hypothetical protein